MGDRQDIDALLIGALYGELEGADQARLDAHLAAHPADRAAMDALIQTRATLRDRLAGMEDAEPAPRLSTLLLQEAARRAPRREEAAAGGLVGWLRGLFRPIVAHPALAGAMTLALVGGAAGLLYNHGRGGVTEPTVASEHAAAPVASAEQSRAPSPLTPRANGQQPPGDDFEVNLDDRAELFASKDKQAAAAPAPPAAADEGEAQLQLKKEAGKGRGYVAVTTPERQPKQLEERRETNGTRGPGDATGAGATGIGAGSGSAAGSMVAADPAAPPPMEAANAYSAERANSIDAWARVQHQRLAKAVADGDCGLAGKLGTELATRAPEYYATHVENDRALRSCRQYIDAAKRQRAVETQKSRERNATEDLAKPDLAN